MTSTWWRHKAAVRRCHLNTNPYERTKLTRLDCPIGLGATTCLASERRRLLTTQQQSPTEAEKKILPIVAYLHLPESPQRRALPVRQQVQILRRRIRWQSHGLLQVHLSRTGGDSVRQRGRDLDLGVVHQSMPQRADALVAAIVDLPEGGSVGATVTGLDPNQPGPAWFGKKVQM